MKVTVLIDNNTLIDRYYLGEPGFCCYLEAEGKRFLLDTGYSGVFASNAQKLGLDPWSVDGVILSHSHNDHTGGLGAYLEHSMQKPQKIPLYAHPTLFRPLLDQGLPVGCPFSRETLEKRFTLRLSREPAALTENLFYLGEIPEALPLEGRYPVGESEGAPDYCTDDTAVAYRGREGVYVITGCSHSGIGNILERAKAVTGCKRVLGVLGGFHLMEANQRAKATIEYLKGQRIPILYPCHCTAFAVRAEMAQCMNVQEAGVSLCLNWE